MAEVTSEVIAGLKALRLHGMAATWSELAEQSNAELERSRWLIEHLLGKVCKTPTLA